MSEAIKLNNPICLHGMVSDKFCSIYFDLNLALYEILLRGIPEAPLCKTIFNNKETFTLLYQLVKHLIFI